MFQLRIIRYFAEVLSVMACSLAFAAAGSKVSISSDPSGAEVFLDQIFIGQTPSVLKIRPRSHTVSMKKPGYLHWDRAIEVLQDSEISIAAQLKPEPETLPDVGKAVPTIHAATDKGVWEEPEDRFESIYPGLSIRRGGWISIKFTNTGEVAGHSTLQLFSAAGALLDKLDVTAEPATTAEKKIAPHGPCGGLCWMSVRHQSSTKLDVTVESVKENKLEYRAGKTVEPNEGVQRWVNKSEDKAGTYLYFLNLSKEPTVVGFCQARTRAASCRDIKPQFNVKPYGSVVVPVGNITSPTLIVESYQSQAAIVLYIHDAPPNSKEFGATSSIRFDDVK